MGKGKKIGFMLAFSMLVLVVAGLGWFLWGIFEGVQPTLDLKPLPEFLSANQKFTVTASDANRGLRRIQAIVTQEGREVTVAEETFPFVGFSNKEGQHRFEMEYTIDPEALSLAQGLVELQVSVWDYSRRNGGDGNRSIVQHKMVVDTIPPALRAISASHYINVGGTGMVVYEISSDAVETGVYVDDLFFPGYPANNAKGSGAHVCYFALPLDTQGKPAIHLWARDQAGNSARAGFYYQIRNKRFRSDSINVSDGFLNKILPYFTSVKFEPQATLLERFLKINRDLRRENADTFYAMRTETAPRQLWEGTWLRLKNAANMARFGDRRSYFYNGQKIDEQTHMGIDLASLANSPVEAANNGRVIFSGPLGIYGTTVVLDHGQGLASIYSHLSVSHVQKGQEIAKGAILGLTGQTGLAGGDHLHFGVMVNGIPVNPLEWWDSHWIQDNVTRKLTLLN
ncbi:Peptidase, M23 family [uncultured Desulfatiglans sp.]|uniref:Peptidase, M23 family n=1 Tax=Uncultured Desulfatiglans sp. TaxID=1748965 RepID=A0A653A4J0_UNCDX|nr:Peptidase, M23 family [uncultured Desulfatiglans sp.]